MDNKVLKLSALFGVPFLSSTSYKIRVMERCNFSVLKLFGIDFIINHYQMQFPLLDLKRYCSMPSHLPEFIHLAQ